MDNSLVPSIGASVATATLLYPLEYYKTLLQLTYANAKVKLPDQPKYFFSGLSAVNLSVFCKTFARFGTFNYFNGLLGASDSPGNAAVLASSLFAGISESFVIVPFENVKVNLIQSSLYNSYGAGNHFGMPINGKSAVLRPQAALKGKKNDIFSVAPAVKSGVKHVDSIKEMQSRHFFDAIGKLYRKNGLYGFFKGTNMTLIRQCSNSIGFFGTYSSLKQLIDPNSDKKSSNLLNFFLSFSSSMVIILLNQPIDVIKTRFQSDLYGKEYKNSLQCAYKIYTTEGGLPKLYAGALPRLIKVSLSSSMMVIFFSYFESVWK